MRFFTQWTADPKLCDIDFVPWELGAEKSVISAYEMEFCGHETSFKVNWDGGYLSYPFHWTTTIYFRKGNQLS